MRRLWKDWLYSLVKILGLAVGMACVLWAILYIRDENSFDRFHVRVNRLYRITTTIRNPLNGGSTIMGATGQVEGPAFKLKIPEIEDYVRVMGVDDFSTNFIANNKALSIKFIYTDESFFDVFSFPLIHGNPSHALRLPNSLVITQQTALRFFGKTDVVGKTIQLEEGHGMADFTITGVAKDIPVHSSIQFEAVLPFTYLRTMFPDETWLNSYLSTFVLLRKGADVSKIKKEFAAVFQDEAAEQLRGAKMGAGEVIFGLQPMADVHLNIFRGGPSTVDGRASLYESSSMTYSYILSGIAVLILIMAIINFLNLSMAGSLKRSKEIAIRKVTGGSRKQIVIQFLSEAAVVCVVAYLVATICIISFLPVFNRLAQKNVSFSFPADIVFFIYALILISLCVLAIGLYLAIKLSLFNPVEILFNRQKFGREGFFNKSLAVVQFSLAIGLIIATVIYFKQMNFIARSDLGYDASDVVKVHLPNFRNLNGQTVKTLRNELTADPSIIQVASGELTMTDHGDVETAGNKITFQQMHIDPFFLPVSGILLKEGRNFSPDFGSDSTNSTIVNETFVRQAGLAHPIGKQVKFIDGRGVHPKTIVGVVKDFHYGSFKEKIEPVAFMLQQSEFIWIKIRKGSAGKALSTLEKVFDHTFPQYFYQYDFVGDMIRDQYGNDQRWKRIITCASALAIVICCIGLIGLAHFETLRRAKEMSVRKVLGSSVINISILLSQEFLKLVLLSILIASPIAWYVMNHWLNNFNYRTQISWLDFAASAILVLAVALVTVNIRALKVAIASPLKYLRSE
jgi:putative ABC transport system permease protein